MAKTGPVTVNIDADLAPIVGRAGDLADVVRKALDDAREDRLALIQPSPLNPPQALLILSDDVERINLALEALAAAACDLLDGEPITARQVDEVALRLEGNAVGLSDLTSGERAHYRRVARESLVAERRDARTGAQR